MMFLNNMNTQMKEIFFGNLLLILCSLLYLAWWVLAFKPNTEGSVISTISIIGAFISGIIALILLILGLNGFPPDTTVISSKYIVAGGAILYLVLLIVTTLLFNRQITSELLLIMGWAVLEFSIISVLYGATDYGFARTLIMSILVAAATIASLVCYVLYYRLSGTASYYDGMVPLITEAFTMTVFTVTML